jgi:dihydroflavonol-4-reductase
MKIFITGSTGFIGRNLVDMLAESDHELYCLVRKSSPVDVLKGYDITLVPGDVTDRESLLGGLRGCDWLINLANLYSFWEPDKSIFRKVNVEGTKNVLECALEAGISKVVHVSTGGIYGKPDDSPFSEESHPGPVRFSEYFRTKYEGDLIAWEMYEKRGLPLVMIYPCAVLGADDPKATGRYLNDLIKRRMPATVFDDSMLTWVYVKDVALAIKRAVEKENNLGEKYLLGKHHLSIGEFNRMVSEISGVPLPRLRLPSWLVMTNARLLTFLSNIIKIQPMLGMSIDQMKVMKEGFYVDGSKAERELGITYTPVQTAVEEAINSFK